MDADVPTEVALRMDDGLEKVMPDYWFGHARLKLWREAWDLSDEGKRKALAATKKFVEKRDDLTPARAMEAVIPQVREQVE